MNTSGFIGLLIASFFGLAFGMPTQITTEKNKESISPLTTPTTKVTDTSIQSTTELSSGVKCQDAWKKFLVDFDVHYASETEKQKRNEIFCENYRKISEKKPESGKVPMFFQGINQWSDHTFEDWQKNQTSTESPETSNLDQDALKLEAAWQTFLTDFDKSYASEEEAAKRHQTFSDNWKAVHENNILYEQGKVSYKMAINQFSDLDRDEWKKLLGNPN